MNRMIPAVQRTVRDMEREYVPALEQGYHRGRRELERHMQAADEQWGSPGRGTDVSTAGWLDSGSVVHSR
jgi:hypothetical protein